jgi:hypothetical protein
VKHLEEDGGTGVMMVSLSMLSPVIRPPLPNISPEAEMRRLSFQRIQFPALGKALSFGQDDLIPYAVDRQSERVSSRDGDPGYLLGNGNESLVCGRLRCLWHIRFGG